jgi:hypothetical protein
MTRILEQQLQQVHAAGHARVLRAFAFWCSRRAGRPTAGKSDAMLSLLEARVAGRLDEEELGTQAATVRDLDLQHAALMIGIRRLRDPGAARYLVLEYALIRDPLLAARLAFQYLYVALVFAAGDVERADRSRWLWPADALLDPAWRSAGDSDEVHRRRCETLVRDALAALTVFTSTVGGEMIEAPPAQ